MYLMVKLLYEVTGWLSIPIGVVSRTITLSTNWYTWLHMYTLQD